jgi:hypothetical protein
MTANVRTRFVGCPGQPGFSNSYRIVPIAPKNEQPVAQKDSRQEGSSRSEDDFVARQSRRILQGGRNVILCDLRIESKYLFYSLSRREFF